MKICPVTIPSNYQSENAKLFMQQILPIFDIYDKRIHFKQHQEIVIKVTGIHHPLFKRRLIFF